MPWVSPLVWPLTLSRPLRSGVWENAALCLAMTPVVWEFSLGVCCLCGVLRCTGVQRNMVVRRVCAQCLGGGAFCFCSWLPEKHAAHASAVALARQWQRCLAFWARGQGGASHHLPTKAQVTRPASALPRFLPSPHSSPHPSAGPAKKTESFSPFFPLLVTLGTPSNPSAFMVQYLHLSMKSHSQLSSFFQFFVMVWVSLWTIKWHLSI